MIEVTALTISLIAVVGAIVVNALRLDWTFVRPRVRLNQTHRMFTYKLRTLVILTAIGPPMLATAWTHREALLAVKLPAKVNTPRSASATTAAKLRIRAAQRPTEVYIPRSAS